MPDNAEWLTKLNWIEMLRDIGRHFSVNRMLAMDSVKLRLEREQEMSFIEFNYMILQAYDYVELNQRYDCRLQMGGSDQWGNIVNGIDLGRRMGTPQLYALTTPLITTASGDEDGQDRQRRGLAQRRHDQPLRLLAVLAQHRGRRRRALPEAVHDLPLDEIARLAALQGAEINEAKKTLADEATALLHGARGGRRRGARPRGRPSRKARSPKTFRPWKFPAPNSKPALGVLALFVKAGLVASIHAWMTREIAILEKYIGMVCYCFWAGIIHPSCVART